MKKHLKQFKHSADVVRLTTEEKASVRGTLVHMMEHSAVRIENDARQQSQTRANIFSFLTSKRMAPVALSILLFLTGGTSYAANHALPGDALYNLKVNVNEEIRASLTPSTEAKASYEAERAERRLQEATRLASHGELSAKAQAKLAVHISKHAEKVRAEVHRLAAQGHVEAAANLNTRLETALNVHAGLLTNLVGEPEEENKPREGKPSPHILSQIREHAKATAEIETDLNERVKVEVNDVALQKASAEGRINAAANKIVEVERYLELKTQELGAEATVLAKGQLSEAKHILAEAQVSLTEQAYGDAFRLAGHAQQIAQEAKLLVKTNADLNLNVNLKPLLEKPLIDIRKDIRVKLPTQINTQGEGNTTSNPSASSSTNVDAHISNDVLQRINTNIETNNRINLGL